MTLEGFTNQLLEFISKTDHVLDCDDLARLIPEQFMDIDQLTEIIGALNAKDCKIDASTDCSWGKLNEGNEFYPGNLIFNLLRAETLRTTSPWKNLYSKIDGMSSGSIQDDTATIQKLEEIKATLQGEIFRFALGRDFVNQRLLGWLSGEVPLSNIFCGPSLESRTNRDSADKDRNRGPGSIERTPESPEINVISRIDELVRFIKEIDFEPKNSANQTPSSYDETATYPFKENLNCQALLQSAKIISSALKPLAIEAEKFLEVCTNEIGFSKAEARIIIESRGFNSRAIDLQESSGPLDEFRKSEHRRSLELYSRKIRFLEKELGISGYKAYCSANTIDTLCRELCDIRSYFCKRAFAAAKYMDVSRPLDFIELYDFEDHFDDRFQAVMLVAISAIDSYSRNSDIEFPEYVERLSSPFIKLEDIASISSMVISLDLFQGLSEYSHLEESVTKEIRRPPRQAEVKSKYYDWKAVLPPNPNEIQLLRDKLSFCEFHDEIVPHGFFDESCFVDEVFCSAEAEQMRDALTKAIAFLSARENEILQHRLGLDGKEAMTLEAVGNLHGLTRERIRQIEAKALRRLRGLALRRERCPELADFL